MPPPKIITGQKISPDKMQFARELRREMTPAERKLWGALRAGRLEGWHFRRQQIIAGFIVDFYCHQAALVVEVDGPVHQQQVEYDAQRTVILQQHGLRVQRFSNEQVMNHLPQVLEIIREALIHDEES